MSTDSSEDQRKPLPLWVVAVVLGLALVVFLFFLIRSIADPPAAPDFNSLPLEERKAAIQQMIKGRPDGNRMPPQGVPSPSAP